MNISTLPPILTFLALQTWLHPEIPPGFCFHRDEVFESHGSSQAGNRIIIAMVSGQVFLENHRWRDVMNSLEVAMVKLYIPGVSGTRCENHTLLHQRA